MKWVTGSASSAGGNILKIMIRQARRESRRGISRERAENGSHLAVIWHLVIFVRLGWLRPRATSLKVTPDPMPGVQIGSHQDFIRPFDPRYRRLVIERKWTRILLQSRAYARTYVRALRACARASWNVCAIISRWFNLLQRGRADTVKGNFPTLRPERKIVFDRRPLFFE